jgi:hypothetical protein
MSTGLEHPASRVGSTDREPKLPSGPPSPSRDFSEDPGLVMTSCANCGAQMLDRKCKLICTCGYFLSCSDYY